jgi:hypothetical protein
MLAAIALLLGALRAAVRTHGDLVLENLALRQQLAAFAGAVAARVTHGDRWFWIALHRLWSRWLEVLVFVKPETVIRWHRARFRRSPSPCLPISPPSCDPSPAPTGTRPPAGGIPPAWKRTGFADGSDWYDWP